MLVGPTEYYDALPPADHKPGDIWGHLPTHGVFGIQNVSGLVITPSCDLANRKVDTITYLPIVSVADYFCSRSFLPDLLKVVSGQLEAAGARIPIRNPELDLVPTHEDIEAAIALLAEYARGRQLGDKERLASNRATAALELCRYIVSGSRCAGVPSKVRMIFGDKEANALFKRIVTNSHRSDLHFLPADRQQPQWSAIPVHSVVLFRCPLSVPIDVLDLAASVTQDTWKKEVERRRAMYPCIDRLLEKQPIKLLRVRPRFISDLLTRFTNLYGRLGSPDFSPTATERFVLEIGDM